MNFPNNEHTTMNTPESSLVPVSRQTGLETSASASAALAKATIEAKFVIALQRPRSVMNARAAILEACHRPRFAEGAWYRKPIGQGVEGFSIRFAEQALNAWRNVDVSVVTAWETDDQRLVRITVTDLEANLSYADEILLNKTVERRKPQDGQEVLGERLNSKGEKVFIIRATEDDLLNKVNAAKSKAIRNSGLRLIPQDILEEAEEAIIATRRAGAKAEDPKAAVKKLADAFSALGVRPMDLEIFLGHSLEAVQRSELTTLRAMYTAIKEGEAKWSDYVRVERSANPEPSDEDTELEQAKHAEPPASDIPPTPRAKAKPAWNDAQTALGDLVVSSGFTFDDFKRWGNQSGNIENADSLSSFDDVPRDVALRLMRAKDGLKTQLAAVKGGVA